MELSCAKTELLAPVGSMKALRLVIGGGADAVYFGAASFHARRAVTEQFEIKDVVRYCHLYGVKAYLTVNINIKQAELTDVKQLLTEAYDAKIDAFIVTDLGLLPLLNEVAPGVPLHASTQLGVAAKEGALFLQSLGFRRVILSRECEIADIRAISETGLEIEYFVHGALCVAFSGSCLLSSVIAGNSGNRGLCKQPCRQKYKITSSGGEKEGYFLSTKDQCFIHRLSELSEAGVTSFKIEGRLKRDAYQGGVTAVYREAIDDGAVTEQNLSVLKRLFNRGNFTEGYSSPQKQPIIYPKVQSSIGEKIAKIEKIDAKKAYFSTKEPLSAAFGFKILRNGYEVDLPILDFLSEGGNRYSVLNKGFRIGDEVCVTNDPILNARIEKQEKKLNITITATFLQNRPAEIIANCQDIAVGILGDICAPAQNAPMSDEDIRLSLIKLGDTVFNCASVTVVTDNVFLPKSKINALRREMVEQLEASILDKNTPNYEKGNRSLPAELKKQKGVFCQIDTIDKLAAIITDPSVFIVFSPENYKKEVVGEFVSAVRARSGEQKVLLFTPAPVTENEMTVLKELILLTDGAVCNNVSVFGWVKREKKIAVAGVNLNIMNKNSIFRVLSDAYLISAELSEKEVKELSDGMLYAYGNLPLMYLKHCPLQSVGENCSDCKKRGTITLKDKKYTYPVGRTIFGGLCQFVLKNPVPADLGAFAYRDSIYLDFSNTDKNEIALVLNDYLLKKRKNAAEHTLLHMKRGVL